MVIKEVSILSEEEFEYFKHSIPVVDAYCWLRSSGETDGYNAVVNSAASEAKRYLDVFACSDRHVQPIIKVSNEHGHKHGDCVDLFGMTWTVLTADDNVCLMMCNQTIAKRNFDERIGCMWDSSALKKWLHNWGKKMALDQEKITMQF